MIDGVTINQLRAFVAVVDSGTFSGAAKHIHRAQSAVSHAIAALESALDVELFERDARRATLSAAGRGLLPDARAVIARTEEMKTRARSIADLGAPVVSVAIDVYFPRQHLVRCLQRLHDKNPAAALKLRMTTMQGGEALVLNGECVFAVTAWDVPELSPSAIERRFLCEMEMVTVCAPTHPLALTGGAIPRDDFSRHVQIVVTDNQPSAEKTQMSVAGERQWLVNELGAKHDFLKAGLGWGHMPADLVANDIANGVLVQIDREAWHLRPVAFMVSRLRGRQPSRCEQELVDYLAAARGVVDLGSLGTGASNS